MDKVTKMLSQMEEKQKHDEIFKLMVFPDTAEINKDALVQILYRCSNDKCDFTSALLEIKNNKKLLKFNSADVCTEIVKDIKSYQDDFMPYAIDGYFINRMGCKLVHLKREDSDEKSVSGIIEYNNLLKKIMNFHPICGSLKK
jgi:hypothetical protein